MPKWRAIVLDLDDTLFPERAYVLSGFAAAGTAVSGAAGIDAATITHELSAMFEAGVRGDTFDRFARAHGLDASVVAQMVAAYREHAPAIAPFPEVRDVLEALRGRVALGLVSDGWLAVQRRKLGALGLEGWFDAIVFSDALGGREAWKPSTRPFEEVCRLLGVEASEAVYVADNCDKDFFGARALGMSTVQVRRAGGEYGDRVPRSPEWAPDEVIADLRELLALVGA